MPDQSEVDEIVYESALRLWAAAQTDFDPFEVDPSEWHSSVPIRDADITTDTALAVDDVRAALRRLEGSRLVLGCDAGTISVQAPVPEDTVP